jgi:hypothetical protein
MDTFLRLGTARLAQRREWRTMPSVDLRLPIPAGQSVSIRDGDIGFDGCVSTRAFVLEEKIHVACLSTASTALTAA